MAPLVLLVCASRSNEVFRIWHTNEHNYQDYHDHVIIRRRFQKFYDLAAKRYEKDLLTIDWPKPAGAPSSYRGYPSNPNGQPGVEDRLKKLKEEVKKAGMYGYQWQPNNQSGFLWADGSGVLMSSTITIVVSIFASSLGREPSVWECAGFCYLNCDLLVSPPSMCARIHCFRRRHQQSRPRGPGLAKMASPYFSLFPKFLWLRAFHWNFIVDNCLGTWLSSTEWKV